jgi:mono/diheme cytochrome c family protein
MANVRPSRPPSWRRGGTIALAAAAALAFALGGGLALHLTAERDAEGRADAGDARQVALGAGVYAAHCSACHGARLEGEPNWRSRKPDGRLPAPPHDATGHTWHHPDEHLFKITRDGLAAFAPPGYETDMPAFAGTLADAEIWAVLAFIKSAWPADERRFQERLNEKAREARKAR